MYILSVLAVLIGLFFTLQSEAVTNASRQGRGDPPIKHLYTGNDGVYMRDCSDPTKRCTLQPSLRRGQGVVILKNSQLPSDSADSITPTPPNVDVIPPRENVAVTTGEIESRCLYSWDDSQQLHSEEVFIELNYQKVKTTMKKLHHCVRLKVTGPIDVEGISKSYVNQCVDYGLKKNSTRHALEALVAIASDIYLNANGTIVYMKLLDYTKSVTDNTMECLTDTDKISAHIKDKISQHFESTVTPESEWIYWDI